MVISGVSSTQLGLVRAGGENQVVLRAGEGTEILRRTQEFSVRLRFEMLDSGWGRLSFAEHASISPVAQLVKVSKGADVLGCTCSGVGECHSW